jgi:hypothetical protein
MRGAARGWHDAAIANEQADEVGYDPEATIYYAAALVGVAAALSLMAFSCRKATSSARAGFTKAVSSSVPQKLPYQSDLILQEGFRDSNRVVVGNQIASGRIRQDQRLHALRVGRSKTSPRSGRHRGLQRSPTL